MTDQIMRLDSSNQFISETQPRICFQIAQLSIRSGPPIFGLFAVF